ncbi:hypothetical protein HPB50_028009 [Hyalomma asiaticum]|nr:hypothetical protein HPB50_028009 [Hyalomma asiaticum]
MKIACDLSASRSASLAEGSMTWPFQTRLHIERRVPLLEAIYALSTEPLKPAKKRQIMGGLRGQKEHRGMAVPNAGERGDSAKRKHRLAQVRNGPCGTWSINVDKGPECGECTTGILLLSSLLLLLLSESRPHERHAQGGKDDKDRMKRCGRRTGNVNGVHEWQLCTLNIIFPLILPLLQEPDRCRNH